MDTAIRYVHGYSATEAQRLGDQADTLAELLHGDTAYAPGATVLEVGCGVGAQTVHLVASSPEADITAVDISAASLAVARARVGGCGGGRPTCSRFPSTTTRSTTSSCASCWST